MLYPLSYRRTHTHIQLYNRIIPLAASIRKAIRELSVSLAREPRVRAGIVAFGVADPLHSGVWSGQGHSGSSWNRTGSRDRPACKSRSKPRNKPRDESGDKSGDTYGDTYGDKSGGALRGGKMTAVARRYTPGGIGPEMRSDFDITFGEKLNF